MNVCDIIFKTKRKQPLSAKEMKWLINGYVSGEVPDYQVSAWLMAVCLNGLSEEETKKLTLIMRDSGEKIDLSGIDGITVDKHSTGGIGDKTSLIIAPVCAACGIKCQEEDWVLPEEQSTSLKAFKALMLIWSVKIISIQ